MRRRRVTYRPGKASGVFGTVWGGVFILIGIFVVIPTFGPFGILRTLMAVGITGYNAYMSFGGRYAGPEIHIEDDGQGETDTASPAPSAEERLTELRGLYDRRLITAEEYEQKRKEILEEL